MTDLVTVQPNELKFQFELRKQLQCSLRVTNSTNDFVAFKVKTTAPKKYCVRPNAGVLQPRSSCNVTFTMQAQREAPTDYQCKDKFLIQTAKVAKETSSNDITAETFNKEGPDICETKLKVIYVPCEPSPSSPSTTAAIESKWPHSTEKNKGTPSKGSSSGGTNALSSRVPIPLLFVVVALVAVLVAYTMMTNTSYY